MKFRTTGLFCLLVVIIFCLATSSLAAQDVERFEVGGFFNYFRISQPDPAINQIGFGGRFAMRVHKNTQIEAEMAYDFPRDFTSLWTAGNATLPVTTRLRTFEGLFGPKFNFGSERLRPFITLKAGWADFNATTAQIPINFQSNLGKLTAGGSAFAFYPAGGVEWFRGHWGLRGELGDLFYYNETGHNNLRATVGMQYRF